MRLLDSRTLALEEFPQNDSMPDYAILSHTWGSNEMTYKDLLKRRNDPATQAKEGFSKIVSCAQRAVKDGFDYVWIDTCCIDKSSSSELSEALNSMFAWYRNASVCYTHLSDIPKRPVRPQPQEYERLTLSSEIGLDEWLEGNRAWEDKFQKARWFRRGWTLQELIAPRQMVFFAQDWVEVGTKADLATVIEACTGIPDEVLKKDACDLSKFSVAQKMSWAANRSTSRKEDIAYCLLGLFDVYMPMLYGEGDGAFIRLQEEIIKISDDLSIFCWADPNSTFSTYRGLLARRPSEFAQCRDMRWTRTAGRPYQITNRGIKSKSPLFPRDQPNEYIAPLWGVSSKKHPNVTIALFLQKVGEDQYARIEARQLAFRLLNPTTEIVNRPVAWFVRQRIAMETFDHGRAAGIFLEDNDPNTSTLKLAEVQPSAKWYRDSNFFSYDSPGTDNCLPSAVFVFDTAIDSESLTVTINAKERWGFNVEVDKEWSTTQRLESPSLHRTYCRKPHHAMVEIIMQRGLYEGESKIVLAVVQKRDPARQQRERIPPYCMSN